MRISDWSSDVCSSDLQCRAERASWRRIRRWRCGDRTRDQRIKPETEYKAQFAEIFACQPDFDRHRRGDGGEIGRAEWRERVVQDVELSVGAVSINKKK